LGQLRHFAQHSTQCHSFRRCHLPPRSQGRNQQPARTHTTNRCPRHLPRRSSSSDGGVQIPNTASLLVLDAIFYLVRGGIAWRALPADFPPHQTVYALFRRWTRARAWCRIYAALRERARLADGRGPVPTAAVIDSQTVRAADTVPTASSGYDGGKKTKGRKRHVAVDTGGLLLIVVTTASLQHRNGAFRSARSSAVRPACPSSATWGPGRLASNRV
jgi:transposase